MPNHIDADAMLQGLTKAALDEEEADRAAAVQEVVTVLSGDIAGDLLESLKSEVDSLVEELRLEVADGAEQEQERQVQQALQVCILLIILAMSRMNSNVQMLQIRKSMTANARNTRFSPAPSAQCLMRWRHRWST